MGIIINIEDILLSTFFVLNNVKSVSQIKKDLYHQNCYINLIKTSNNFQNYKNIDELFENFSSSIESISYYDGRIFYRVGNEFHTKKAIKLFDKVYTKK